MIHYFLPDNWIKYDAREIAQALAEAKATVIALRAIPYQKEWVDKLQKMELKREVAGTSRIEGADFTEREFEVAVRSEENSTENLLTRSQKQARSAIHTYNWIATLPHDMPVNEKLISEIHSRIVTGADDDHCEPGRIRSQDQNVNFGQPRHRGASGGVECLEAFRSFASALQREYIEHDPLIQALAAHYHLAAMHPYLDGNGRTARAMEALLLQRAGLRDTCFIAMSNYYYDEKIAYLAKLSKVRENKHDLSEFLIFALKGIAIQGQRLTQEIQVQLQKALFRNMMHELFNRLKTPRKRVIAKRQLAILDLLLNKNDLHLLELFKSISIHYNKLKKPWEAFTRDLNALITLRAIEFEESKDRVYVFHARLTWPTEITSTEFFKTLKSLPTAKTYPFLQKNL